MASFALPADLILYYDSRRVSQLVTDTGTPATDLDNNAVVLAMLARATEEILSHALKGKKYTEDELQELADSPTSGYFLVGLCCDLAYGYLVQRRGTGAADMDRQAPSFKTAQLKLLQLADGSEIFPRISSDEHGDAGTPSTVDLSAQITSTCKYTDRAFVRLLPSRPFGPFGSSGGACGGNC